MHTNPRNVVDKLVSKRTKAPRLDVKYEIWWYLDDTLQGTRVDRNI